MDNQTAQPPSKASSEVGIGLGGWMIPVIFLVCLFPIFHTEALLRILFSPEITPKWNIFLRGEGHVLTPWSLAWSLEGLVHLTGLVTSAYNLALLFAKRKKFVKWILVYLVAIPLTRIFGHACYSFFSQNEAVAIIRLFWPLLAHLVSIAYLINAKRVKNTFVH